MNLIVRCHQCPKRQRPCNGPCACTLDGVDIIDHAEQRYCPAGRYRLGVGDVVARLLYLTGVRAVYLRFRKTKTCGECQARQTSMNDRGAARRKLFVGLVMKAIERVKNIPRCRR